MSRAQCIVHRGERVLMVKHLEHGVEYWCLPGGGIMEGETPEAAALRELEEECLVTGRLVRPTATTVYGPGDSHHTFLVDIGDQEPALGLDPEYAEESGILMDIAWKSLDQVSEIDRAYLWTAGLLSVPEFFQVVQDWPRTLSVPCAGPSETHHI